MLTILSLVLGYTGFGCLQFTDFGMCTYRAYKRTKRHIQKRGRIHEKFKIWMSNLYCDRVGMELAIKEANLELNY